MNKNDYYVYLHRSNETGEVFYVGKGRNNRCKSPLSKTFKWEQIASKGFTIEFHSVGLSNSDAYAIELDLIKTLPNLVNVNVNTKTKDITEDDLTLVYYDETSYTCLRYARKVIGSNGRIYKNIGDIAGIEKDTSSGKDKRFIVRSQGKAIYAHRLVYALHNEISSDLVIDHIDGNSLNNKLSNLRQVTQQVNSRNIKKSSNKSTNVLGVSETSTSNSYGIWHAYIATWYDSEGKLKTKQFACKKYGLLPAFTRACEWRKQKIEELNAAGAGYTERHGT